MSDESTVAEVADRFGGYWEGEHPEYDKATWRVQVANNDTLSGYWQWVLVCLS